VDIARLNPKGRPMRAIRGRAVSLVFQEPMTSFSPAHTIGNQIIEVITLHLGLDREAARARAIDLLDQVGIPDAERRIDTYAFQLSGGMRQRAMIAMALACDPMLLIADEPTTALDVTTQAQILALLRRLQKERGLAILLITHNLGVVAQMADEVVVMYLGKVVERGPVDTIFHAPQHPYTRALLRSMPSIDSQPRTPLPTIAGAIPHVYSRPQGCAFHPRCPEMMPGRCDRSAPQMRVLGTGHEASCFLHEVAPVSESILD
jgi:peptide/nickel transport system ATP-binding protein